MKDKKYYIEILNIDTGVKVKQKLDSPELDYNEILEILQSYNPEIDFETLVVYYYTRGKWIILLDSTLNLDEHELEWQIKESDELLLRIKYHCFYLLDDEEEKRFNDDVKMMNEKINEVHELYQDLKEKYKQEALDISIFWGSPLFAADKIQRNKKQPQFVKNADNQDLQLLTNQVKYAPYVNAVTTALETCDKKKVHLEIDQLNDKSFNQKNVFTVVYLMAHLEIVEMRNDSHKERPYKKSKYRKQQQQKKEVPKRKYVQKNSESIQQPTLEQTKSQMIRNNQPITELKKQPSAGGPNDFQMIIQESLGHQSSSLDKSSLSESTQFLQISQQYQPSLSASIQSYIPKVEKRLTSVRKEQSRVEILNVDEFGEVDEDSDGDTIYYEKDYKNRRKGYKYYFLGQEINGGLCKISPNKLKSMIKERTSRKIQLLILHTSFPDYHLKQLRQLANNIILINSNPLVPEPSTIFFIKQLFIHLLQTGNIEQTYELSITDLNKLKQISMEARQNPAALKEFDERDIKFVNNINEKYVHGSLECCCCYHRHHDKCHNRRNQTPSKFAQYHYKYHAGQCDCQQQNLMIHHCEGKRSIMKDHYEILDKHFLGEEYYYCCCVGQDLGFYDNAVRNTRLEQLFSINQELDPHSIQFKYKYEKKMIYQQDNQLEINEGKVTGDWSNELINAFKYIESNPLLGNAPLTIRLFEIFTEQLKQCTLDIIRRSSQSEIYNLCNIYGEKSTGRRTIATYFGNLMIIKKLCKRIVIKTFNNASDISEIIASSHKQEGRPFFILIHQEKNVNRSEKNQLRLSENHFRQPISAIIITQQRVLSDHSLKIPQLKPIAFNNENCQHYIKKYKHLSFQAKNNIRTLFNYGIRGYENNETYEIYPFSLNQFEILNLVRKTKFNQHQSFTLGLDRLRTNVIEYYVAIMYIIKFTNSSNHQKNMSLTEIQKYIESFNEKNGLFFRHFDDSLKKNNSSNNSEDSSRQSNQLTHADIKDAFDNLINLDQIRDNFYLIFTSVGYKMKNKLTKILKMFINYSTIIPNEKFSHDPKIKRDANYIRKKQYPFSKQIYEATTINPSSYINRYFAEDFQQIYEKFTLVRSQDVHDTLDFELFLQFHADLLIPRKSISKKLDFYTKPKEKRGNQHNSSVDSMRDIHRISSFHSDSYESCEQNSDIPNIYHLASVIQGGLQFVRNVVGSHFIYNRLKEKQKIELLKYSMLLINNCIILLKNKRFYDINEQYDLEVSNEDHRESNYTQKIFHSTHNLDSPDLRSNRSEEFDLPPVSNNRTYSGRDIYNQSRQYTLEQTAMKSMMSHNEEERQPSGALDELLLAQLYRLSTYKGLLFLLDEIARRLQEFSTENDSVLRIKICVQLLAIQIRLEQLQVDKQTTKITVPPSNSDRHLGRIAQIFNQKNYNISILYRILRQQILANRFGKDIQELGLIKSHIIISLTLMASRYGKYKIAKAKSMIEEIDSFVSEWNAQIPLQTRQSQTEQSRNNKNHEFLSTKQLPCQYGFLKLICENQYVYLHILQAFTHKKYWVKEYKKNLEIQIYQQLLGIYHHFTLKNTKAKSDYYSKLENIMAQLYFFKKKKEYAPLSTYIHNFVEYFMKLVENQLKKLKSSLVAIFTAEDDRDYVKTSLNEELQPIFKQKSNEKQFFSLKKKLNINTLNDLQSCCGCKYLCIFTSIGEKNSKQQILIETSQGRAQIIQKQKITQAISLISSSVIFVCLPRKKMLAQSIKRCNRFKRSIIYFDFQMSSFDTFKTSSEDISSKDYINIFEKMIIIATVKELIAGIIQKENEGFKTGVYMAFNDAKNCLSFVLKGQNGKPLLRLSNKQFRKCLFIEQQDNFYELAMEQKQIQFFETEIVNKSQIEALDKINKKMSIRKQKTNNEKYEKLQLDEFQNIYRFIQIFSFYFREKYGFTNIFSINFSIWKQSSKPNVIIRQFLEKLTQQNILDYIFSTKKVIVILFVEPKDYDSNKQTFKNCESKLWNIINGINQLDSKRIINKFLGYSKKKINNAFIYILQSDMSLEKP